MSGQTQHSPVKTSNLPDKCPMSGANLQACFRKLAAIFATLGHFEEAYGDFPLFPNNMLSEQHVV